METEKKETFKATGLTLFESNVLLNMMGGDIKSASQLPSLEQFKLALYAKGAAALFEREFSQAQKEIESLKAQLKKSEEDMLRLMIGFAISIKLKDTDETLPKRARRFLDDYNSIATKIESQK